MTEPLPRPIRIGHRGAAGHAPENTLAAVEAGVRLGADFIEVDLQTSRDGEFVVMHDKRVDRTTNGTGRVGDLTLRELLALSAGGEPIPTLHELLLKVEGRAGLLLEIITPGSGLDLLARVQSFGFTGPLIYSSFLHSEILAIRRHDEKCQTMALIEGIPVSREQFAVDAGATHAGLAMESLTEDFAHACNLRGLQTFVYTVNHADDIDRAIRWGASGIISDFPERIGAVR